MLKPGGNVQKLGHYAKGKHSFFFFFFFAVTNRKSSTYSPTRHVCFQKESQERANGSSERGENLLPPVLALAYNISSPSCSKIPDEWGRSQEQDENVRLGLNPPIPKTQRSLPQLLPLLNLTQNKDHD